MELEKVTREILKAMKDGDTLTFNLPNYAAVESGKNTAYTMQRILNCSFSCSSTKENPNILSITRHDN